MGERERGEIGGENQGGGRGERKSNVETPLMTQSCCVTCFMDGVFQRNEVLFIDSGKKKKKSRVSFLYLYKAFYVFGWVFFFDFINEIPF